MQAAQRKREMEMEQQRIEIGKQYQQLQIGLKKQQLDQMGQLVQARTQQAARQFQIQQTFQQKQKAYQAQGMDEQEATRRALMEVGPGIGTGAAQFYKDMAPPEAEQVKTTPGGEEYIVGGTRPIHTFGRANIPGAVSQADRLRLAELQKQRAAIEKQQVSDPAFLMEAAKAKQPNETAIQAADRMKREKLSTVQRQINAVLPKTAWTSTSYSSPDDVKAAVKSGKLTRQQALQILRDQFEFE